MKGTGRRAGGIWLWRALLAALLLGRWSVAQAQQPNAAQDARLRIGFSNLVARLDNDQIGFANAQFRVYILEALRSAGYNAVGAESLVFEHDEAARADLVLGGTVRDLECREVGEQTNCGIGIEWELLDREQGVIVYRVLARHAELGVDRQNAVATGRRLTLGALQDLLHRSRFRQLLARTRDLAPPDDAFTAATFRGCSGSARELPAQFNEAANATFIVKQGGGFGTGFNISPDGLVLTAAHVVDGGSVQLVRRGDTTPLTARVVRISHRHDVALLALSRSAPAQPCLELETAPPSPGDDVYAIGSPASQDLAFSLTRGIVSGIRSTNGIELLQTDASLNPGNSGGPLLDRHARVVGVVSRKLAGEALEGLGFGVLMRGALSALQLRPDATTTAELLKADVPVPLAGAAAGASVVTDTPSPMPSLDPAGDRRRADALDFQRRREAQSRATPWYIQPTRWGGLSAAAVGTVLVIASSSAGGDNSLTRADWQSLRTKNDIGWALLGLGAAAFVVSFPLEPGLPPAQSSAKASARWSIGLHPGTVSAGGSL